jgi:hypothetical protein
MKRVLLFLFCQWTDRQLEFEVDATGKVTKIWFYNGCKKEEMKKID